MIVIIVLETKNNKGSDFFYFKSILSRFYLERGTGISLQYVYLNGKCNYDKKERVINDYIRQSNGQYKVICVFDIDSPELNYDQRELNISINDYCNAKEYEVVWFNKTVEHVLLGDVIKKDKTKIAENFYRQNKIKNVCDNYLCINNFEKITEKKSNVLNVLDKYLKRK